ncbi:nuclear transport factor 2 family protein, partial [Aurantimonas sp. E1-2-R+4]|uniref:nuclear transport factor 2 family protein n=1 Tax=Aurantimonas sp. E1-2-R+4 TaxID=3113714 RepID=UPI002F935C1D
LSSWRCSPQWNRHPEPNGSRRATPPTSEFQQRPGHSPVSEWTFSGTNADGTKVEAQGADLFTLRGGKIVVKQAFRKNRPLLTA